MAIEAKNMSWQIHNNGLSLSRNQGIQWEYNTHWHEKKFFKQTAKDWTFYQL